MLPFALLLRSVQLIALTPLIGMVSGYSLTSVRFVTALVTFFPSLVNISVGLESAPKQSIDLIEAYGGTSRTALLKVRLADAMLRCWRRCASQFRVRWSGLCSHRRNSDPRPVQS